jgi:hypothetical protein
MVTIVLLSVNATVSDAFPERGVVVNAATGGFKAFTTTI